MGLFIVTNSGGGGSSTPDKNYIHEQTVANTTWTINHSLSKFPSIDCVDDSGNEIKGDLTHISNSQAVVVFAFAYTGKAYCN